MLTLPRNTSAAMFALCIASSFLVCQAEDSELLKQHQAVPRSLLTAGPIEPLRDMAGEVTITLHRSSNQQNSSITGELIGLDGNWVVIRVDHMNAPRKTADFQWIPVANIERMIQHKVYPDRLSDQHKQE